MIQCLPQFLLKTHDFLHLLYQFGDSSLNFLFFEFLLPDNFPDDPPHGLDLPLHLQLHSLLHFLLLDYEVVYKLRQFLLHGDLQLLAQGLHHQGQFCFQLFGLGGDVKAQGVVSR